MLLTAPARISSTNRPNASEPPGGSTVTGCRKRSVLPIAPSLSQIINPRIWVSTSCRSPTVSRDLPPCDRRVATLLSTHCCSSLDKAGTAISGIPTSRAMARASVLMRCGGATSLRSAIVPVSVGAASATRRLQPPWPRCMARRRSPQRAASTACCGPGPSGSSSRQTSASASCSMKWGTRRLPRTAKMAASRPDAAQGSQTCHRALGHRADKAASWRANVADVVAPVSSRKPSPCTASSCCTNSVRAASDEAQFVGLPSRRGPCERSGS